MEEILFSLAAIGLGTCIYGLIRYIDSRKSIQQRYFELNQKIYDLEKERDSLKLYLDN
jgi:hypothetical protein